MKSLITYLKNVRGELSHVVWPKPRQAAIHTAMILLISIVVAVFVGLVDYGLTHLVDFVVTNR